MTLIRSDYKQSITMKLYYSMLMISLTTNGNVEILKNRFGTSTEKATTEEVIECVSEIISNHIFNGRMKMFTEHMKTELKETIKHIIKGGEVKCVPLSENEQEKWV